MPFLFSFKHDGLIAFSAMRRGKTSLLKIINLFLRKIVRLLSYTQFLTVSERDIIKIVIIMRISKKQKMPTSFTDCQVILSYFFLNKCFFLFIG